MKKLTKEQKKVLEQLAKSGIFEMFYLTGGTAITVKNDHRLSEDLDFFTIPQFAEDKFPFHKLLNYWSNWGKIENISKGTIQGRICGVLVSFFSYPYPLIRNLEIIKINDIQVTLASDEDLIATKAIAIMQRGQKKDFFDFYFLLSQHKWTLNDVISFCHEKYISFKQLENNLLKALTYFNDAEGQQILLSKAKVLSEKEWSKIKNFFEELVRDYCRKIASGASPSQ